MIKNIICCIIILYVSELSFNYTMSIINIAQLHNDIEPLSEKKLIIDFSITAHLIINKNLIHSYYKNFEQY